MVGAIGSGQTKEPGQAGWTPLPLIRDDQALGSGADADGSGAEAAAAMAGGALAAVGQADTAVNSGDTSALDPDFFRNISLGDDPAVGQDRPDVPLGDTPDPNDPADPTDTDPNADGGGDGTDGEGLNPAGEAVGVEEEGPDADGVAADPGSEIGGALVADGAEVQAAQGAGQAILQENTNPPQVPPPPPANDSVVGTYSGSLTAVFDPDIGASVPISGPLALSISQQSAADASGISTVSGSYQLAGVPSRYPSSESVSGTYDHNTGRLSVASPALNPDTTDQLFGADHHINFTLSGTVKNDQLTGTVQYGPYNPSNPDDAGLLFTPAGSDVVPVVLSRG